MMNRTLSKITVRSIGRVSILLSEPRSAAYFFAAFTSLLLALSVFRDHFAILTNDYFPLLEYARRLEITNTSTWFNGFYPVGFPLLLRTLDAIGTPSRLMLILNVLLGGFVAYNFVRISHKLLGGMVASILASVMLSLPLFLRAALNPMPELLVMLLVLIGARYFLENRLIPAALAIGLTALLRTHMILFVLIMGAAWLYTSRNRTQVGAILLLIIPFLIQSIISFFSGHGPFANYQNFNLYRQMYGVDWANPALPTETIPQLILSDTSRFVIIWVQNLVRNALPLLVLAYGVHWSVRRRIGDLASLLIGALGYLLIASIGGSGNVLTPMLPLILISTGLMISRLPARAHRWVAAAIPIWLVGVFIVVMVKLESPAKRMLHYTHIGKSLNIRTAAEATRVLSADFSFYFPYLDDAAPTYLGGWGALTNESPTLSTFAHWRGDWLLLRADQAEIIGRLPRSTQAPIRIQDYLLFRIQATAPVVK